MGIEGFARLAKTLLGDVPEKTPEDAPEGPTGLSTLPIIAPFLGLVSPFYNAIVQSSVANHPLFPVNDKIANEPPASAQDAIDGLNQKLAEAQSFVDHKKFDDADRVLEEATKKFYFDLPKEQRGAFKDQSNRYLVVISEVKRMKALVLLQQGKKEQADDIINKSLKFLNAFLPNSLGEKNLERAEALLVRGKLNDLAGDPVAAKKDFEEAASIDPSLAGFLADYEKHCAGYAEEGEKLAIASLETAAADGLIPEDKISFGLKAYATVESGTLQFTDAFNKLSKEEKAPVLQELSKIAHVEKMRTAAEEETDAAKKLFLEGQVALADGNLPLAQLKLVAFKAETKDSKEPAVIEMRQTVGSQLRALALTSITQLEHYNELLVVQHRANPEMLATIETDYRGNKEYLAGLKSILEGGRCDTLEEAQKIYGTPYQRQDREFRENHVVGHLLTNVLLPFKAPSVGSEGFFEQIQANNEVVKAYRQTDLDPALLTADGFPGVPYVRLEGGSIKLFEPSATSSTPDVIRVVIGKEGGGIITADRKLVKFPPRDTETVVLLKGGRLEAKYPLLKENKDYSEVTIPFLQPSPDNDNDFQTLLKLHTSEGWEKMTTREDRNQHLLETARALNHRNGSYPIASELLEEILAPQFAGAVNFGLSIDEKTRITKEVEGERNKSKTQVLAELKHFQKSRPTEWAKKYPAGEPSDAEINAMVDAAQERKLTAAIKIAACGILRVRAESGVLGDDTTQQAWDLYNDMNDYLNETFNLSSESWDRITDEIVITAVTMPITMGAGKAAHAGIKGLTWMRRLASMGRLGNFAAETATLLGVSATEGLVQQATNPVTALQLYHDINNPGAPAAFSLEEQFKAVGWNIVMAGAFNGGGKGWEWVAQKAGIAKTSVLNAGGTLVTQTGVATGMGEFELWYHDKDAPGSLFERIGGHGLRMVGYHYGTQVVHIANGGQLHQTETKFVETSKNDTVDANAILTPKVKSEIKSNNSSTIPMAKDPVLARQSKKAPASRLGDRLVAIKAGGEANLFDNGDGNVVKVYKYAPKSWERAQNEQNALVKIQELSQIHPQLKDLAPEFIERVDATDKGIPAILMSKLPGTDIESLTPDQRTQIPEQAWSELEASLKTLNEAGIAQNDLVATNILWDGHKLRIVDFGGASLSGQRFGQGGEFYDVACVRQLREAIGRGEANLPVHLPDPIQEISPFHVANTAVADVPMPSRPKPVTKTQVVDPPLSVSRTIPADARPGASKTPAMTTKVVSTPSGTDANGEMRTIMETSIVKTISWGRITADRLKDPELRASIESVAGRNDALGESARNFLAQAETFQNAMEKYETMAGDYWKSHDENALWELNSQYEALLEPAANQLYDSNFYKLNKVFDAAVDKAGGDIQPLLFELSRQEVLSAGRDQNTRFDIRVKSFAEAPIDPNDPVSSLLALSASDLITVEISAADPRAVLSKLQKAGVIDPSVSYDPARTTYPVKTSGGKTIPIRFNFETPAPPVSKKSSWLPSDAALAGIGPAAGMMADFFGMPPAVWIILGAAGMLMPFVGMLWKSGSTPDKPTPLRPNDDGSPLTVGRDAGNDVVVSDGHVSSKHFELHAIKDGNETRVLLVDGTDESPNHRSRNGTFVNGKPMTGKHQWVKPGDRITAGSQHFIVEEPGPTPTQTPDPEDDIPTTVMVARSAAPNPANWNDARQNVGGIAVSSHLGVKDGPNEDRYVVVNLPNKKIIMVAIDGMGGHEGGARAAEVARVAMQKAANENKSPKEIIEAGHEAVMADNEAQGAIDQAPGAVGIAVEITPRADGNYDGKVAQIGDSDCIIIRLDADEPIIFNTTRPGEAAVVNAQLKGKPYARHADGRLKRGQTLNLRMDEAANIVDGALGHSSGFNIWEGKTDKVLKKGDIIISGSDGLFENFGSLDVIVHIIKESGAKTPNEIRDVLMTEVLIRQNLLSKAYGRALNQDDYVNAYRSATGGQEPPANWRGMYEPFFDSEGNWHSFEVSARGVVTEAVRRGNKIVSLNPVDHFKLDNATAIVQVLP